MKNLDPVEPVRRYEPKTPGELIHIPLAVMLEDLEGPIAVAEMCLPRAWPPTRTTL
jgi:hypothetical protein